MKKLPKFWKIYIFTVTVIILLFCVFLVFLAGYLKSYESKAQSEAALKRAAEAQRYGEEKDEAERKGGKELSKRTELIAAVKKASDDAVIYISSSKRSSPQRVMEDLVLSLNENGVSAVSGYIKCDIGKYEDLSSVVKYIDGVPGAYSYDNISTLEYSLKKGELNAHVTLTETNDGDSAHKSYGISSVSVDLPLLSYKVFLPEGASLSINGKTVEEEPVKQQQSFPDSIPESFPAQTISSYELDGFVSLPEFKAQLNGEECDAAYYEDKVVFADPSSKKYEAELFDRICELSFAYSDYVSGAFDFGTMRRYLYPGTKFYKNLSGFDTRWYYEYHHIVNENAKVTEFTVLSDNLIFAHIEFDQSLRNSRDNEINSVKIVLNVYIGCDKVPTGTDKSAWLLINAGS